MPGGLVLNGCRRGLGMRVKSGNNPAWLRALGLLALRVWGFREDFKVLGLGDLRFSVLKV